MYIKFSHEKSSNDYIWMLYKNRFATKRSIVYCIGVTFVSNPPSKDLFIPKVKKGEIVGRRWNRSWRMLARTAGSRAIEGKVYMRSWMCEGEPERTVFCLLAGKQIHFCSAVPLPYALHYLWTDLLFPWPQPLPRQDVCLSRTS